MFSKASVINPRFVAEYLEMIDIRNEIEKAPYDELFTDYSSLLQENIELQSRRLDYNPKESILSTEMTLEPADQARSSSDKQKGAIKKLNEKLQVAMEQKQKILEEKFALANQLNDEKQKVMQKNQELEKLREENGSLKDIIQDANQRNEKLVIENKDLMDQVEGISKELCARDIQLADLME